MAAYSVTAAPLLAEPLPPAGFWEVSVTAGVTATDTAEEVTLALVDGDEEFKTAVREFAVATGNAVPAVAQIAVPELKDTVLHSAVPVGL
jgi:hypothetical protein